MIVGAITAALGALGQSGAFADCGGNGLDSGAGSRHVGATGSTQSWSWELSTRHVTVGSVTGGSMSTDLCLDAYFDWMTQNQSHYDRRTARNCAPGTAISSGTFTEPTNFDGSPVTGLQKAAGCKYLQVPDAHLGDCSYDTESARHDDGTYCEFTKPLAWTSKCSKTWIRHEDQTVHTSVTTDVNDCNN
jgi:hypothetical protein